MLSRPGRLAVAVAAACLLAGCQPPASTTTPVPTYQCTPEAGGAEFGCSQHQYDEMVVKDKLYAEAEAVYRKFLQEEVRVLMAGGAKEPTTILKETTAGAFLAQVMGDMQHAIDVGLSVSSGSRRIGTSHRLVGASKGGSVVAMSFCVDSSSVHFTRHGKRDGNGSITQDDLYFAYVEGLLKIIGADGKEVTKC